VPQLFAENGEEHGDGKLTSRMKVAAVAKPGRCFSDSERKHREERRLARHYTRCSPAQTFAAYRLLRAHTIKRRARTAVYRDATRSA